jgi:outer membrane protein assembly factor BamE (lipoprotein component of BamABCDE complex)
MQLEFVPVEEFYFALTLAVRTLDELGTPGLAEQMRQRLEEKFGQPSTVAAASQNTYNYVFRVNDVDNSPAPQLILSVADWQGNLRLSSDYGWTLDGDRKPIRTDKFSQRSEFARQVWTHLQELLQLPLEV